jgi:hypothetical protein
MSWKIGSQSDHLHELKVAQILDDQVEAEMI